jgi:hypothetical protein
MRQDLTAGVKKSKLHLLSQRMLRQQLIQNLPPKIQL